MSIISHIVEKRRKMKIKLSNKNKKQTKDFVCFSYQSSISTLRIVPFTASISYSYS